MIPRSLIAIVLSILALALAWLPPSVANAQEPRFQYAVKFVCGKGNGEILARGTYFTAINVHNPSRDEVRFQKSFVVALPRQQPGPVFGPFDDPRLGPDEAFEIDSVEIMERTQMREFVKGFVVIRSNVELDVVAVYTAAGANGDVVSMHTERVPVRRMERD
jgi:hypothetical protein